MRAIICLCLLGTFIWGLTGCGVKGDPVPPATPAEIGRGKPLFKGEEDNFPTMPKRKPPASEQKDEQEEDDDN